MNIEARRISLFDRYQAPLTAKGRTALNQMREATAAKLERPPQAWFQRYLLNLDQVKFNALLERFPNLSEISVNVTWGCSGGCVYCHIPEPARVESMPWPWVKELAAKNFDGRRPTVNAGTLLGDPLRDYYDPLFDKDFGDVDRLFTPFAIVTAGFEIGSIGERAARKIVARRQVVARFTITVASQFYKRLGYEEYIRHMRSAFSIFPTAYFVVNGIKEKGDETSVKEIARRVTGSTKDIPIYNVGPVGRLVNLQRRARFDHIDEFSSRAYGPNELLLFQPSGRLVYRQAREGGVSANTFITKYDPEAGQVILNTK